MSLSFTEFTAAGVFDGFAVTTEPYAGSRLAQLLRTHFGHLQPLEQRDLMREMGSYLIGRPTRPISPSVEGLIKQAHEDLLLEVQQQLDRLQSEAEQEREAARALRRVGKIRLKQRLERLGLEVERDCRYLTTVWDPMKSLLVAHCSAQGPDDRSGPVVAALSRWTVDSLTRIDPHSVGAGRFHEVRAILAESPAAPGELALLVEELEHVSTRFPDTSQGLVEGRLAARAHAFFRVSTELVRTLAHAQSALRAASTRTSAERGTAVPAGPGPLTRAMRTAFQAVDMADPPRGP